MPAAVSVLEKKDKSKSTVKKVKRQSELASADMAARKKARIAKVPNRDGIAISETKQLDSKFGVQTEKKKRKPSAAKISKDEKSALKDVEKTEVCNAFSVLSFSFVAPDQHFHLNLQSSFHLFLHCLIENRFILLPRTILLML
jgi:hypothetical protein